MRLYANNNPLDQNYVSDTNSDINSALESMGDQLISANAISEYEIVRFRADETGQYYPCISEESNSNILASDFKDFLQSTVDDSSGPFTCPLKVNGTGTDLYSCQGVHALVHDWDCTTATNGGNSISGDENCDGSTTAFVRGRMVWFNATCVSGLTKNTAIQEPLHQFIMEDHPDVKPLHNGDEHSLGMIRDGQLTKGVTPMLTYHEGEDNGGTCTTSKDTSSYYSQVLTTCTTDAVKYVSTDSNCTN